MVPIGARIVLNRKKCLNPPSATFLTSSAAYPVRATKLPSARMRGSSISPPGNSLTENDRKARCLSSFWEAKPDAVCHEATGPAALAADRGAGPGARGGLLGSPASPLRPLKDLILRPGGEFQLRYREPQHLLSNFRCSGRLAWSRRISCPAGAGHFLSPPFRYTGHTAGWLSGGGGVCAFPPGFLGVCF